MAYDKIRAEKEPGFPVTAIRDHTIVEVLREPETYGQGPIIRPDAHRFHLRMGRVVATGPGALDGQEWRIPPARVGDIVLFTGQWQGEDLPPLPDHEGRAYRVLEANQVAAVVECDPELVEL